MKKIIYFILIAIVYMTVACHKDAQLTTLASVSFSGSLTVTPNNVALSPANDSLSVITFNWPGVVYPVKAHVTYTLQVDLPVDTVGANAWANATSILIGNDILTKTFKGSDLNALAIKAGMTANDTGKLVFRVQAYQDRNAYSNAVTVTVKPYKLIVAYSHNWPILYIPGDYQGWAPATAPMAAAEKANVYEGYINVPAGGTYQLKFSSAQDWGHINYADAGGGNLTTSGTNNLALPGPGYYELIANTSTLTWSYTLVTWGILGDATPGGWNTDTQMSYDATKKVWTVTCAMLTNASFKFRANNAWNIDFGIDHITGILTYADHPTYGNISGIDNITVPSSGNYTITLDLHDPNNYNYSLHKN